MNVDTILALLGTSLGHEAVVARPMTVSPDDCLLLEKDAPTGDLGYGIRSPGHPGPAGGASAPLLLPPKGGVLQVGTELPPVQMTRSVSSPTWGKNNPAEKCMGSGFKTSKVMPRRSYTKNPMDLHVTRPALRLLASPSTTEGGLDPIPTSHRKMFGYNGNTEAEQMNSFHSASTMDMEANKAIFAIHKELYDSGKLPSEQPEKVLSDGQIEQIAKRGAHRRKLMDQILDQKLRKTTFYTQQSPADEKKEVGEAGFEGAEPLGATMEALVRVTTGAEVYAPKTLKAPDTASPTYIYTTEVDKARILNAGVPAGVGMALWGDRDLLLSAHSRKPRKGTTVESEAHKKITALDDKRKSHFFGF